jgi:integrase
MEANARGVKYAERLQGIQNQIVGGTFDYAKYFPTSKNWSCSG